MKDKYYTIDCGTHINLRFGNPDRSNSHVCFMKSISSKDLRILLADLNKESYTNKD